MYLLTQPRKPVYNRWEKMRTYFVPGIDGRARVSPIIIDENHAADSLILDQMYDIDLRNNHSRICRYKR